MRRTVSISITVLMAVAIAFSVALYTVSEAHSATYSQIVDNSTAGRFKASSKWVKSTYHADTNYGKNHRALKRSSAAARSAWWKVNIPTAGTYRVYARWPADAGYTSRAKFRVKAADGTKTKTVSQKTNGGRWVRLGTYSMAAGDGWSVGVASTTTSKGYIVADAVKVVNSSTAPTVDSGGSTSTMGAQVVAEAETWLGVRYEWGGMDRNGVDCSGLTYRVYEKFGKALPRTSQAQYSSGPGRIIPKSEAKPGDMVFFGSGSSDVVSVGIVSGPDEVIKATVPGDVVRRESISAVARNVGGWTGYRRVI
mgnify:CR=1 FL=1